MTMYIGSIFFSIVCILVLGRILRKIAFGPQGASLKSKTILELLALLQKRNEDIGAGDMKRASAYTLFFLLMSLLIAGAIFI